MQRIVEHYRNNENTIDKPKINSHRPMIPDNECNVSGIADTRDGVDESYGPNGGVADTFEDAKAAFRRNWDGYGAFESACGRSPRSNEELHEWLALRRGR
jgi:hypothetical protein